MKVPRALRAPMGRRREGLDFEGLAAALKALASASRLEILEDVAFPRVVSEVKLAMPRGETPDSGERLAARQTIQAHLDTLVDAGFVSVDTVERDGRELKSYVSTSQRLFAVIEELRRLSVRYGGRSASEDATGTLAREDSFEAIEGPRLVLVHGVYEAKQFALRKDTKDDDGWLVGRRRGLSVSLDYDPFVSLENSRIRSSGSGFTIEDLAGSKNGTTLNWNLLTKGVPRPLTSGDLVGVGRTRLLFLDHPA